MKSLLLLLLASWLSLAAVGQSSEDAAALLHRFDDADANVRAAAKQRLKEIHDPAAVAVLLQALRESRGHSRRDLLDVLAGIEDKRKIEPLIESLPSEPQLWDQIGPQLIRFGVPPAEALLRSVPSDCLTNVFPAVDSAMTLA
jgi:HEAT repeat protein